jgi:hypothetical protein
MASAPSTETRSGGHIAAFQGGHSGGIGTSISLLFPHPEGKRRGRRAPPELASQPIFLVRLFRDCV